MYYTITGTLPFTTLSGGVNTSLVALGVTGQLGAAVEGGVFVSVSVDSDVNGKPLQRYLLRLMVREPGCGPMGVEHPMCYCEWFTPTVCTPFLSCIFTYVGV